MNKKIVASLIAGVVILSSAVGPLAVQAAERDELCRPSIQHQHFDPDKVAQRMAESFGVSREDVLKYHQDGVQFKELFKASFLAKASGKSLQEVMRSKTYDNTWKDVAQTLGVTREMMRSTRQDLAATNMESKLSIPKQTSLELLQQGYHPRDIAVANELAKNTDKPIIDVLSMKKINNTWFDVANSLGINESTFKQDISKLKATFPHRNFHQNYAPMI